MTQRTTALVEVVGVFVFVVGLYAINPMLGTAVGALATIACFVAIIFPIKALRLNTRLKALSVAIALALAHGTSAQMFPDNQSLAPSPFSNGASSVSAMWVTSDRLNKRSCPSTVCGVLGQLFHRQRLDVYERDGTWARISGYYDASCRSGRSDYVDTGPSNCTAENGIENGQVAEWVSADYLSSTEPVDPAETATVSEQIIRRSDDFSRYRVQFLAAATGLIGEGTCTEEDFVENGGWVKSSSQRDRPVYFTYCGGSTVANRIYLNAENGETYR